MPSFQFPTDPPVDCPFTCAGVAEGRIKPILDKVMNAIPQKDRAPLRAFWEKYGGPTVEIVDQDVLEVKRDDGSFIAFGATTLGVTIRFAGRALAYFSDELVERLIAHEFGHAVLEREERDRCLPPKDAEIVLKMDMEALAAGGPQFDQEAIKKKYIELLKPRTEWNEAAVNKRTQSWDMLYDDKPLRDLIENYRKHKGFPPKEENAPPH